MGALKSLILLLAIASLVVVIPEVEVSNAQSETIVVPDDYPTIAEAVEAATENDTVYVKKGTYDGPINQTLVINKTISLIGEDPETTILNLHPLWRLQYIESPMVPVYGYDESIKITANDVELSGFTFKGQGNFYVSGPNTQINNNVIKLYLWLAGSKGNASQNKMAGITIGGSNNTITQNTLGGIDVRFGSLHTVYDNVVTHGSGIGVLANNNKIFNNTVSNCKIGVALSPRPSSNAVYGNILTNNEEGIVIYVDGDNNLLYENYVANNRYGVRVGLYSKGGENTSLYHNNFVDNIEQVKISPKINNYGVIFDNGEEGNYWSDYNGTDADSNGIGDTPYVIDEVRQDNYPLMEPFVISGFQFPDNTVPALYIDSPQNRTYSTANISASFSWDKSVTVETPRYINYWVDDELHLGLDTFSDSNILEELSEGSHNFTAAAMSGTEFVNSVSVQFTVDFTCPVITILNPTNATYQTDPQIGFTIDEPTSWMGYSLDGQNNVTVTGNMLNLTGLTNGVHNITVYANDTAGNTGTSETFMFTVAKEAEPTPWTETAILITTVAIVTVAILAYLIKTRRKPTKEQSILAV